MAEGVGLAFLQANIVMTALAIGAAITVMAASGMLLGHFLDANIGKWAANSRRHGVNWHRQLYPH